MGGVTSSYVYDSDGLRTQKTVGTTVYDYYWNNSKLSAMTITNGSNITTMMFAYDSEGMPFAMSYNLFRQLNLLVMKFVRKFLKIY